MYGTVDIYDAHNGRPLWHGQIEESGTAEPDNIVLPADNPPKSGVWVDSEDDVLAHPTKAELASGKKLGESIDTDDDEDAGL